MTKQELLNKQARYYEVAQKKERTETEQRDYEAINISCVANEIMMIEQEEREIEIQQEIERLKEEQDGGHVQL